MNASGRLALCLALVGRAALASTPEETAEVLSRAARFYEGPASKEPGLWRRFLQLLDREGLAVETVHAVHSSRAATRAELDADLDFGN